MKTKSLLSLFTLSAILLSSDVQAQIQGRRTTGTGMTSSYSTSSGYGETYRPGWAWEALIETDPDTGSLIIIADEETNERIREIIENLDRPVPQVLIKVVFLEVTHRDDLDLGTQFFYDHGRNTEGHILETAFGAPLTGGFYRILEEDVEITMSAMSEVGKMEVLSRPSVLARHNQEATIVVGQEVPFVTGNRVTSDGQTINDVEYEDIGIILRVTPYITADGQVEMVINPEISTLTEETVPISNTIEAPVIAKRAAETRVVMPDGNTVVIGGLIQDDKTTTVRKIPVLGSIPILGFPFRRTIKEDSKTELLIFLTPHVVVGKNQLAEMSDREKERSELSRKAFSEEQMKKYMDDYRD